MSLDTRNQDQQLVALDTKYKDQQLVSPDTRSRHQQLVALGARNKRYGVSQHTLLCMTFASAIVCRPGEKQLALNEVLSH